MRTRFFAILFSIFCLSLVASFTYSCGGGIGEIGENEGWESDGHGDDNYGGGGVNDPGIDPNTIPRCDTSCSAPGACGSHGGVDCPAGPDSDGSVICNDGYRDSSIKYQCQ